MEYIKVKVTALLSILTSNVLDFNSKHKEKKKSNFNSKLTKLAQELPNDLKNQETVEQLVKEELTNIDLNSKTRHKKFMYPSILSEYKKGMNPIEALHLECPSSIYKDISPKETFAIEMAYKHKDEVVPYLEEDLSKLTKVKELARTAIAPQYAMRPILYFEQSLKDRINFFKKLIL